MLIGAVFSAPVLADGKNAPEKHLDKQGVSDSDDGSEIDDESEDEAAESALLQKEAILTLEEAENAALAQVPGKVTESELENENGMVVYGIEISNGKTTTDVKIDAKTGDVVSIEEDGNESDMENQEEEDGDDIEDENEQEDD